MREPFWKARACVTTLLILEVIVGILIILVTAIYQNKLSAYLPSMERKVLGGQFFNTYALGVQLFVTYLCSYAMWKRIWCRRFTPNIQLLLSIWMFFCFLIVLCGFGTVWTLFTCADAISNTAETSLIKGIDLYYTCPEWKLLWDSLQYHKECCGVNEYKDWMKASWMPHETEKSVSGNYCSNNTFGDLGSSSSWDTRKRSTDMAMAPYACCKHSCTTCYQNYIPRPGNSSGNPPYLSLNQINTKGCLPQFVETLWHTLYFLLTLVIVALKIDIFICSLTKYLIVKNQQEHERINDNVACMGDDGRPQVVVKFPPNVRLMALEEREVDISDRYEGGEEVIMDSCTCCPNYSETFRQPTMRQCPSSCGCTHTIIH